MMNRQVYLKILFSVFAAATAILFPSPAFSAADYVNKPADSSEVADGKVRFAYDVDFKMNFDNREFDRSHIFPSYTILGARLTPCIGVSFAPGDGSSHRLMLGIDVMKDFGRSPVTAGSPSEGAEDEYSPSLRNSRLLNEVVFYYGFDRRLGKTDFSLMAGIIPRRFMSDSYSTAFFSDSLAWYDNNIEGLLLKFRRPASSFEVGCDWMGMAGVDRRERFMIFSSGAGEVSRLVSLGYSAYMYHFAGSANAGGVVDNILVNPYLKVDFSRLAPVMQTLYLSAGWLQSLQNDRELVHKYVAPGGAEIVAGIGKWNVSVVNRLFYGGNMMPYYNSVGTGGRKYASDLYFGDPFYRVRDAGGWHCYDRLEVVWEPGLSDFVDLKVAAVLHFSGGFTGWQQMVSVHFNLQEFMDRLSKSRNRRMSEKM